MIVDYYRPKSMEEALKLLSRNQPVTVPLGGGTVLNRPGGEAVAVVDLQSLGLDNISAQGNILAIGAAVTLQDLVESEEAPDSVQKAARLEASINLRNVGTIAGTLVSADSRSPLTTLLLAMDARIIWQPGETENSLGEWLPMRGPMRGERNPGLLISEIHIPKHARTAFESVGRTPADWPIVCVGITRWSSNRTRLAVGGFGKAPIMVVDGGTAGVSSSADGAGIIQAVRDAYSQAGDEWASAEYRQEVAAVLARRCLEQVSSAEPEVEP